MSEREYKHAQWLAKTNARVETSLLIWMLVHGNLCLALRHPLNRGPSRELVVMFTKALGRSLVELGAMTPEELKKAEKLEAEEGSLEFAA